MRARALCNVVCTPLFVSGSHANSVSMKARSQGIEHFCAQPVSPPRLAAAGSSKHCVPTRSFETSVPTWRGGNQQG